MDRGAWQATVHRVTKNQTLLSDFHLHFFFISFKRGKDVPKPSFVHFCKQERKLDDKSRAFLNLAVPTDNKYIYSGLLDQSLVLVSLSFIILNPLK